MSSNKKKSTKNDKTEKVDKSDKSEKCDKNIEKEIRTLESELLNNTDLNMKNQVLKYTQNQTRIKDLIKELEDIKTSVDGVNNKTRSETDNIINYEEFLTIMKDLEKDDDNFLNNMEKMSLTEMINNYVNLNLKLDLCLDFLEAQKIDLIEE